MVLIQIAIRTIQGMLTRLALRRRPPLQEALTATQGIWRDEDGLSYQQRLRGEWD
jgi:hypothetical protein